MCAQWQTYIKSNLLNLLIKISYMLFITHHEYLTVFWPDMFDPHVCTYQVVTYHLQQYETYLYNIFCYILTLFYVCGTYFSTCIYKKSYQYKNFLPQGSYFMKVNNNKKNFSNRKCNIVQKCAWFWAHKAVLRFPTLLHWLDLPQKNSSSWQNLVENLHQDKLKHQNCWQFIHSFSKPFFSFFHVWCNGVQSLDRSVEKNPEAHRSKEFQNR